VITGREAESPLSGGILPSSSGQQELITHPPEASADDRWLSSPKKKKKKAALHALGKNDQEYIPIVQDFENKFEPTSGLEGEWTLQTGLDPVELGRSLTLC
jgi:hypothetical protein